MQTLNLTTRYCGRERIVGKNVSANLGFSKTQKQIKRVLKSIGFNQVTFANGDSHAESPLTHYCCRTNITSHAELPPRVGHKAARYGSMPSPAVPPRAMPNHARIALLLPSP